jgi:hypothetical protein
MKQHRKLKKRGKTDTKVPPSYNTPIMSFMKLSDMFHPGRSHHTGPVNIINKSSNRNRNIN